MKTSAVLALFTAATFSVVGASGNDTGTVNMKVVNDGQTHATRPRVIEKKKFSSKLRLTYWIGLEGSGHHLLVSSFDKAFKTHRGKKQGMGCTIAAENYYLTKAMVNNPGRYEKALDHARADMQKLHGSESSAPATGDVVTLCSCLSYPSDWGPEKVMQYLDVALMAELAEAEGVDLRIICLKRLPSPKENHSTEDVNFMHYARILYTDAGVMHSYLAGLDPKFVVCHDMNYVGDEEQASAIANFVAPTPEMAEALRSTLIASSPSKRASNETLPIDNAEIVVERLQRKLDVFESNYCHGKD